MLPEIPDDSALARLFRQEKARNDAVWFSLPGGQTLFKAHDEPDNLYLVKTGRLGAFRHETGQEPLFLGVIRPGEPAGEMALIAGIPHTADVVALRDSEIYALPKATFFAACEADASVMTELAKLMILRTRQAAGRGGTAEPSDGGWRHVVSRQVDRLFRVGRGDRKPAAPDSPALPLQSQHLVDLILLQKAGLERPEGSEAWLDATAATRLFHLRRAYDADYERLARVLTGQSVGLVFS